MIGTKPNGPIVLEPQRRAYGANPDTATITLGDQDVVAPELAEAGINGERWQD